MQHLETHPDKLVWSFTFMAMMILTLVFIRLFPDNHWHPEEGYDEMYVIPWEKTFDVGPDGRTLPSDGVEIYFCDGDGYVRVYSPSGWTSQRIRQGGTSVQCFLRKRSHNVGKINL